jgi:hypothetical protein
MHCLLLSKLQDLDDFPAPFLPWSLELEHHLPVCLGIKGAKA